MKCVRCQTENRIGSKFCEQCGTAFARACSSCGNELSVTAKFCANCGQPVALTESVPDPRAPQSYTPKHLADKILNSKSALEGERKQVTVLFVDIVGSTSQSENVDPEEAHALMGRAIEVMVEEVHRYEGTVNQFLGDGVMALFGAPIAHEDHARRAIQAALAIQRALQPVDEELRSKGRSGLQVRQGLNTGLVVVGSIGTDLRMDYTAVGDITNVAALAAASEKLGEALQIVKHPPPSRWMTWRYSTHCYASLGELALARGDLVTADGFADQSLQIAVPTRSRKFESRAWRIKGDIALVRRQWDAAEEALRQSLAIAQEIDEPRQLWKSHAAIGRLNRDLERVEAADRSYHAAAEILERHLANVRDPGLRAGLELQLRGLREL